jgi:2-polyprenyl-6-methoxyphenol hydroxylase-like FAD-dependent oxidoreductase
MLQYGKRLDHIESDGKVATAIFEDGTREVGNLLIGAEGAHSKVRHFLLSPDKSALHMSPFVGSVAITKLPAEAALRFKDIHPRFVLLFHPNGIFGWIGGKSSPLPIRRSLRPRQSGTPTHLLLIVHEAHDGLKPGEWTFMIMQTWISEHDLPGLKGPKIVEDMKERGRLFAEPFNALFQSMPEDSRSWHSRLSYWPTEAWDNCNGTLTLIGDAAHPMTFRTSSTFLLCPKSFVLFTRVTDDFLCKIVVKDSTTRSTT